MSKNNSNFFKEKKIWSTVKDELLGCYLVPYFNKILNLKRPVIYVDCFAGKGKFDDGQNGSPLIAYEALDKSVATTRIVRPQVDMYFIELNHATDLRTNLADRRNFTVIEGKFEDNILAILQRERTRAGSVFLYVDPYGIKALSYELFSALPQAFTTAELLINLNSFGFIREACRVKSVGFREREDEIFSDLDEYDTSQMNSVDELNAISGGDYWQAIIKDYNSNKIDCYEAEKRFSAEYKAQLRKSYNYVLDMPIRLKQGQHPKYRMVYATNHEDGCILMADNIAKRTDRLVVDIQSAGQLGLFTQTADNDIVLDETLQDKTLALLSQYDDFIGLNKFMANFYNEYGVLCDTSRLSSGRGGSILKALENSNRISVVRNPATTEKGKQSTFWSENAQHKLQLRKR